MKKLLIFSLILASCSFKSNTDKTGEVTIESVVGKVDMPVQKDNSAYFYFQNNQEFLCVKKTDNAIDIYTVDTSEVDHGIKRFRGEVLRGDTVYIEWRDYNQFDNDKNLLFEPAMGGKPDALWSIASKLNIKACAVERYPSFDMFIEKFKKRYMEIDSAVFYRAKKSVLANLIFPLPKYLHLMDRYYSPPLFFDHQKIEIKAKGIDNKYYKYFASNNTGQLLSTRVRAIIAEDGTVGLIKVLERDVDEQETLSALRELLKNIKARNYSILNSPVKAEISMAIILNKSL